MILLDRQFYSRVLDIYSNQPFFFPLIAAVLSESQMGTVFVNNFPEISQVYVEHKFGFSQVFGKYDALFNTELEQYLLNKKFSIEKVRLYIPDEDQFLRLDNHVNKYSLRQRAFLGKEEKVKLKLNPASEIEIIKPNLKNIFSLDCAFNIVNRFWKSEKDFIKNAKANVLMYKKQPAAICYAAACENNKVELDIITLDKFRNRGFAKIVASHFIRQCQNESLDIYWDCFENNLPSMSLAKILKFDVFLSNYKLYTITKME